MLFDTSRQLPLFCVFCALGYILGVIYGILHFLRGAEKIYEIAADIIFSVVFFASFSAFSLIFSYGEVKFIMFLGVFSGFSVESHFLGNLIKKAMDFFRKILYNLYVFISKAVGQLFK